ncbi:MULTISPECIES: hypothetical protein [Streptomyces]|uniref:hypothetical protein n=1 Tax=Streptomyces TaxID=1883 RepID=UPI00167558F5|nr:MULTISPECIES: hypothetical protein [Streptomyces]MBK3524856.1 hypothetical protein [Streptomyces sp. MBT70]GGR70895.1 hypothetical protein GCM10010236_26430 [Streptomyces eurythermus]
MTDRATTAEPDLTELAPLVRVVTGALRETPLTLGTPAGIADLAATITVRVAAYVGREVLPPDLPANRAVVRAEVLRMAEMALRERANHLTGEYNDSDILHEDGPAATVATWNSAADLVRRLAGEQPQADGPAAQRPAGLTVEALARLLAGGAGLAGGTPPYDQLPTPDRERYVDQARQLMARWDGGQL